MSTPTTPPIYPITPEQLKELEKKAAETAFNEARKSWDFVTGGSSKWMAKNQSGQIEYYAMQAVKIDLDGLALTDEGLTLFGAKIADNPLKNFVQKKLDAGWEKLAEKYQGRFARQIFDKLAPESVHQARRDALQDERIGMLARATSRLAELNASVAHRRAQDADDRASRPLRRRANRESDRAEAAHYREMTEAMVHARREADALATTLGA